MRKDKHISHISFRIIIGIVLYRFFLDWVYKDIITEYYSYMGFLYNPTERSLSISWVILLGFIPFLINLFHRKRISSDVIVLLFLTSFVPMTSLMRFMPMDNTFLTLYILYWGVFILLYYLMPSFSAQKKIYYKITPLLWIIIGTLIFSVLFVSGYYFGFRISFDLSTVYDLRTEVRETTMPGVFGYLIPAAGSILPIFLVYFMSKRNKLMTIIITIVILLDFSIGGHKSVFFKLILCFIGYFFFTYRTKYNYSLIFAGITLIAALEKIFINTFVLANYGIRRVFFVPGLLNYQYYDFFSKNEHDYFRQSILRRLGMQSPYQTPIPRIVGEVYYGRIEMNANNGLFSDAYAHLGLLSILMPFLIIVLLKLMDKYSVGIEIKLLFLPIVILVTTLISGSFFSILLTDGLLLLLIVLFLFPRNKKTAINIK